MLLVRGCVCFGERRSPSYKECNVNEQTITVEGGTQYIANVADCSRKGWTDIPRDLFDSPSKLKIDLSYNPFKCECNMVWFLSKNVEMYDKLVNTDSMVCSKPPVMKGFVIVTLISSDVCASAEDLEAENLDCKKVHYNSWKDCEEDREFSGEPYLDCTGGCSKEIIRDIFSAPLQDLRLAKNPYKCDCNMSWFFKRLRLQDFTQNISDFHLLECRQPQHLAGKKIQNLTLKDICPEEVQENQCAKNTHDCHKNAYCLESEKSYNCSCRPGFTGDGKTCTDINECHTTKCPKQSKCKNLEGSYECLCNMGYKKTGQLCSDIDECKDNVAGCHKHAICLNTAGSFKCVCKDGYIDTFNGLVCEKKEKISCKSKQNTCLVTVEICVEKNKQLKCVCKNGFSRPTIYDQCEDINECEALNRCPGKNTKCKNTFGSYKCYCEKGYSKQGDDCVDTDECAIGMHNCHRDAICINLIGGYNCRCKAGFQQLKNGKLCLKKAKNSNKLTVFVISSVVLLFGIFVSVVAVIFMRKNQSVAKNESDEEDLLLKKGPGNAHQNLFPFNHNGPRVLVDNISVEGSNITVWSEDEYGNQPSSNSSDFD